MTLAAVISNKKDEPIELKIYLLAVRADAKPDELLLNAVYIKELGK